jgi:hypothetical protein
MSKAKSDKSNTGLVMVPWYSIMRIGKIFVEGLRYGRDNWKKGVNDKEYQEERFEHAMVHLIKYKEGDTTEDHLAKVAWFCVTQMELMRLEQLEPANVEPQVSEEENDRDIFPLQLPLEGAVIYRNREGRDVVLTKYDSFLDLWYGNTIESQPGYRNQYTFRVNDVGLLDNDHKHHCDLIGELKDQKKYNK